MLKKIGTGESSLVGNDRQLIQTKWKWRQVHGQQIIFFLLRIDTSGGGVNFGALFH